MLSAPGELVWNLRGNQGVHPVPQKVDQAPRFSKGQDKGWPECEWDPQRYPVTCSQWFFESWWLTKTCQTRWHNMNIWREELATHKSSRKPMTKRNLQDNCEEEEVNMILQDFINFIAGLCNWEYPALHSRGWTSKNWTFPLSAEAAVDYSK